MSTDAWVEFRDLGPTSVQSRAVCLAPWHWETSTHLNRQSLSFSMVPSEPRMDIDVYVLVSS